MRKHLSLWLLCSLFFCLPSLSGAYTCDPLTNACRDLARLKGAPSRMEKGSNPYLTLGVLGTGLALYVYDDHVLAWVRKNKSATVDNMRTAVGNIGNGVYEMGMLGAFVGAGYVFKDVKLRDTSFMAAESFLAANCISTVLKYGVGRGRPYHDHGTHAFSPFSFRSEHTSFPSGHTTSAFSVASVFAERYDSPFVGILAYGAATAVVFQRVYTNNHWPSDVFAGAVLGTVTGRAVVRFSKEHEAAKSAVLLPVYQPGFAGLTTRVRF